jgi:hypothetical protein
VGLTWGKFVGGGRISEGSVEVLLRINCVVDPKCKGILQMGEVGFWEGVVMVDFGLGFEAGVNTLLPLLYQRALLRFEFYFCVIMSSFVYPNSYLCHLVGPSEMVTEELFLGVLNY